MFLLCSRQRQWFPFLPIGKWGRAMTPVRGESRLEQSILLEKPESPISSAAKCLPNLLPDFQNGHYSLRLGGEAVLSRQGWVIGEAVPVFVGGGSRQGARN